MYIYISIFTLFYKLGHLTRQNCLKVQKAFGSQLDKMDVTSGLSYFPLKLNRSYSL